MDPAKKDLYTSKRSSGVNTNADPKVQETINLLLRNTTIPGNVNWMLTKVVNSNELALASYGSNGLQEMIDNLTNDEIYYGFIKCINKETEQIKFYSTYFIGEDVSGMKKGKSSLYKAGILSIVDTNGEVPFNNLTLSEYNYDYVFNEVQKLSKIPADSLQI